MSLGKKKKTLADFRKSLATLTISLAPQIYMLFLNCAIEKGEIYSLVKFSFETLCRCLFIRYVWGNEKTRNYGEFL